MVLPKGDVELVPLATVNAKASPADQHHPSTNRRNALQRLVAGSSYRCIVLVLFVAIVLLCLNQTPTDATFEFTISKTDESRSLQNHECQLFLAQSSMSNRLAIFTTADIPAEEQSESRDICVPQPRRQQDQYQQQQGNADYDAVQYQECQGFAALMSPLSNSRSATNVWAPPIPDNGGLHRAQDPAAGAITNLFGATTRSKRKIQAGSELTIYRKNDIRDQGKRSLRVKVPQRSTRWIKQNGMCIDHIDVQLSDGGRGRGAFAKRKLQHNFTVAPMPLHVFQQESGDHDSVWINYCWQPRQSDLLLYPYAPFVNTINHSTEPNVALRWSTRSIHNSELLQAPDMLHFWDNYSSGSLVLEVFALRDIEEGEEIFLDYGAEYQQAWEQHVQQWKKPPHADDYVYAFEMKTRDMLYTIQEQQAHPYPDNLVTICYTGNGLPLAKKVQRWKKPASTEQYYYCQIVEREKVKDKGEFRYRVAYLDEKLRPRQLEETNVPRSSIQWVDKPGTSDFYMPGSFRHPMILPDDLVPAIWRTKD